MPLDPSIYSNVGRVNIGEGISNIIDQQRQRDAYAEERQNRLSVMANQQQAAQQAQAQKRNQDLNMWLSSAVQSGRPIEEVMPEAIAKGQEIGVMPDVTQKHVTSVFGAQTPQARSDVAFTQAYPELVAKQRAESMFTKPDTSKLQFNAEAGGFIEPPSQQYPQGRIISPTGFTQKAKPTDDIAHQRLELERQKFEFEKTKPQKAAQLSPTAQKELFEAEDIVQGSQAAIGLLDEALLLNDKAYSGYAAKERAVARSNLPGESEEANATINLDNIMTSQALESLKAVFGGMPTEGERKILLDMQASADKTPAQRKDIITRAKAAATRRIKTNQDKAKSLRQGTYFTETPNAQESADDGWEDL